MSVMSNDAISYAAFKIDEYTSSLRFANVFITHDISNDRYQFMPRVVLLCKLQKMHRVTQLSIMIASYFLKWILCSRLQKLFAAGGGGRWCHAHHCNPTADYLSLNKAILLITIVGHRYRVIVDKWHSSFLVNGKILDRKFSPTSNFIMKKILVLFCR